jgi:hypothetical protein
MPGAASILNAGPEDARYATTYFVRVLNFEWLPAFTNLTLCLLSELADGFAVYLNGTEVFRRNLPGGPVSKDAYTGLDASDVGFISAAIDPGLLQLSTVLAVELHQNRPDSSVLVFDLALMGTVQGNPPGLIIYRSEDPEVMAVLSWDPLYWYGPVLQYAYQLDGPWQTEYEPTGRGEHRLYPGETPRFFRLRWPPD